MREPGPVKGRCAGCAFWTVRKSSKAGWGDCEQAACYSGQPFEPGTLAYAVDWAGQSAQLTTREDFGCVQFLKKA